ncbi:MAG TPA: hypothetical protein VI603_07055 [Saprospiraceae bacterium]|nr:hypothetical protein [Saprospiraceae bacterium]
MNQKNIFTGIAVVLILQGIVFFIIGDKMVSDTFPGQTEEGHRALRLLLEVPSALSILLGLIAYASRNTASVLWAFTLGTAVLLAVTLKHMFVDSINVPIPAVVIQALILLSCAYLWLGKRAASS